MLVCEYGRVHMWRTEEGDRCCHSACSFGGTICLELGAWFFWLAWKPAGPRSCLRSRSPSEPVLAFCGAEAVGVRQTLICAQQDWNWGFLEEQQVLVINCQALFVATALEAHLFSV